MTVLIDDPIVLSADAGFQVAVDEWSWVVTGPDGGVDIDDPTLSMPVFTARAPGLYQVRVSAKAGTASDTALFTITAVEGSKLPWVPGSFAFHRETNQLALGDTTNFRLEIHDVVMGMVKTEALTRAPVSLAFTPDGTRVVVGQDAQVQIVSLEGTPTTTWPLSGRLLQVAATNTQAFFVTDAERDIGWVHLANGEEGSRYFFYSVGGLRMHPDQRRMYAGNTGVSPDDVIRFELGADGGVEAANDSRYHGDYQTCGNAWISRDGTQLFSACGVTHRLAPVRADDLVYGGSFPQGHYTWMDESNDGGVVYALAQSSTGFAGTRLAAPRLLLFERATLRQTRSIALPDVSGSLEGQLRARFVFVDSNDTLHILLEGADGVPTPRLIWLKRSADSL